MINSEYRKKGYSKLLLEDSFEYLKTDKPVITIPELDLVSFLVSLMPMNGKSLLLLIIIFQKKLNLMEKRN